MRETKMKKVLAVVLAFAMVMAMGVMTFAAEAQTTATPSLAIADNGDGTLTLTLSGSGDFIKFDFGVAYDSSKVSVVPQEGEVAAVTDEFTKAFGGMVVPNDQTGYDYVVIGGATTKASAEYNGVIATIVFKANDMKDIGEFKAVIDSAALKKANDDANRDEEGNVTKKVKIKDNPDFASQVKSTVDQKDLKPVPPTPTPEPPTVTDPTPSPEPPVSTDPTTEPPVSTDPATQAPATQAPVGTTAPDNATKAPATQAPATKAPTTSGTKTPPPTGDTATVVIPMVAIVAAVAAVVVASKKKVED